LCERVDSGVPHSRQTYKSYAYDEYESLEPVPETVDLDPPLPISTLVADIEQAEDEETRAGKKGRGGRKRIWPIENKRRVAMAPKIPTDGPLLAPLTGDWEDEVLGWGEQDAQAWESLRRAYKHGGSRYEQGDD
jgi:hypothetical protein